MVCEGAGRGEPVVDVLPGPLARLPSEKAALIRCLSCAEFELRAHVAIALNKLDASFMETTRIRAPWGPLAALEHQQHRAPAAL